MPDGIGFWEGIRLEIDKLKKMTLRQKGSYFLTYYLKPSLLVLFLLVCGVLIAGAVRRNRQPSLISGALINVYVEEEGERFLKEGLLSRLSTGKGKERVGLVSDVMINFDGDSFDELSYTNSMRVASLVAAGELDYMVMGTDALEHAQAFMEFADLRELLSAETLAALSDRVLDVVDETGERFPGVIELSGTLFAGKYVHNKKPCYLAFVANGRHLDRAEELVTCLK